MYLFRSPHGAAPLLPSTPRSYSLPAPSRLQFWFPQGSTSSRPATTQKPNQFTPQKAPTLHPSSPHTDGPHQRPTSSSPIHPPPAQVLVFHPSTSSSPQHKKNSSEQGGSRRGKRQERLEESASCIDPISHHSAHLQPIRDQHGP